MKKIILNEENIKNYQKLYDIKKGDFPPDSRCLLVSLAAIIIYYLLIFVNFEKTKILFDLITSFNFPIIVDVSLKFFFPIFLMFAIPGVLHKRNLLKKLKKECLDLNIDINTKELQKEIETYKNNKKLEKKDITKIEPETFLEKSEERSFNYEDKLDDISTEQLLAFLEEEKDFWEQVKINEEIKDMPLTDEQQYQMYREFNNQKKIGSIEK